MASVSASRSAIEGVLDRGSTDRRNYNCNGIRRT